MAVDGSATGGGRGRGGTVVNVGIHGGGGSLGSTEYILGFHVEFEFELCCFTTKLWVLLS